MSKKIKRSPVKSFPALSHRAEEDLIKKSPHVFSLSCTAQKRGMGSGSLHKMQDCKLWCCARFWERYVALDTLLNFSLCYSVVPDTSTPTMGRDSMCELWSIWNWWRTIWKKGELVISNIPNAKKKWKGFFCFPSLSNMNVHRNTHLCPR